MVDRPIIGQLTRADAHRQSKIEVIGGLKEKEWAEFYECLKECAASYGNRLTIRLRKSKIQIPILKRLPKKKKKRTR